MTNPTLVAAAPVPVTYLDGTTGSVDLARLTVRQLYRFIEFATKDRTPELVAFCAGKTIEWVDTLTDESYGAIAQRCIAENFPRAMKLAESDGVIALRIAPMMTRIVEVAQVTVGVTTSDLSPASSASPAGIGSALSTTLPPGSSPS